MVNLSKEEIKQLTGRKDWLAKDMKPIYVTTAVRRGKLSPALKWRLDNCNKIYHSRNTNSGINYKFIFQVVSFDEMGLFYNCANLILMEYNDHGEIVPVINNATGSYFAFFVQLNDLDKYFKRYYTYNALHGFGKDEWHCFNDIGINFKVVTDYIHKTVTVTNIQKLLIDNNAEPYFSAKAFCHKNDDFDFNTGKQIAMDKWNAKWKKWFNNMIKLKKNVEDKQKEIEDYKKENETMGSLNPKNITLTKCDDFIGTRFGDYTVVGIHHRDNSKHVYWLLRCPKCENEIIATKSNLIKGKVNVECPCCLKECANDDSSTDSDIEDTNPVGDFVSDPDNCQYVKKDDNCFVTGLSTEKDKDEFENSTTVSCVQVGSVFLYEEEKDLFSMPVWYSVAHCIPADKTLHGAIAKKVDNYWNISDALEDWKELHVGTVVEIGNVYNLIATPRKHEKTTMKILEDCLVDLANLCYENYVYNLAMPRIGCGANGMKWDEVRELIIEVFCRVYKENDEYYDRSPEDRQMIQIVVCNIPNKGNN